MNEANYASLSAGLLARKGQAKPAMRPAAHSLASDDDLGWNDMGGADLLTAEQRIALMPDTPVVYPKPRPAVEADAPVASPAVEQQQQLVSGLDSAPVEAAPVAPRPIAVVPAAPIQAAPIPRPRAAPGSKAKAAFTLRLDPERHMQLRLACVYGRKSAQQLVLTALDEYISAHFPDAANSRKKSAAN